MAVDSTGSLYVSDRGNGNIRKVTNGVITTIAYGVSADALAVDSSGNVLAAEGYTSRILRINKGVIATVAGTGTPGFSGDNVETRGDARPVDRIGQHKPHRARRHPDGDRRVADFSKRD